MFKIVNKPKSPKTVWDADKKKPLLTFNNGVFETEDAYIAEKAKKLGYDVTGEEAKKSDEKKKSGKGNKKDSTETPDESKTTEEPETAETSDDSEKSAE